MPSITLHVNAPSKAEINRRLERGDQVFGVHYTPWDETDHLLNAHLPTGTVIKIWEKMSSGSPVAKAYGTWDARRCRLK